jgi:hypothetical protein
MTFPQIAGIRTIQREWYPPVRALCRAISPGRAEPPLSGAAREVYPDIQHDQALRVEPAQLARERCSEPR